MLNDEAVSQTPLLADVTVNYRPFGPTFLLTDSGEYFAKVSDLRRWGIRGPYPGTFEHDGHQFARLRALGDVKADYDPQSVTLTLEFPPELLPPQQATVGRRTPKTPTSSTGAYLDYDLSYVSGDISYGSGFLAPTVFSPAGVIHAQVVYQGYEPPPDQMTGLFPESSGWIRLDTTYTRDFPTEMRSLRVGDVIQMPGTWGNALRLGGVQIASNFSTQPSFVSFPVPNLAGSASLPSTLDLYVDGALRHRQQLEPGPFQLNEIPVVTGSGQMRMVVTDVLGRQQIYYQDFYASNDLLKTGLSEYSYSFGALRENFGRVSNDYGDAALLAHHRYGVNDELTVGGRLEIGDGLRQLSGTVDWSPDMRGVFSVGVGVSRGRSRTGSAWSLGYRYQSRAFNVSTRLAGSSEHFTALGLPVIGALPKTQLIVSGGWRAGLAGTLGLALVHSEYRGRPTRDIATLSHSHSLFRRYSLSSFVSYTKERDSHVSFGMTVTTTFGHRSSASGRVSRTANQDELRFETQSSLPVGPGFGYRVGTTVGERDRFDARLIGQTDFGRYTLDVDHFDGSTMSRVGAGGSIAWLAGRPYVSREINEGFAVARVGNVENVRVYLENQEVGRSDRHGRVLLPMLRPYEINQVRIEPADLPLASEVPRFSMAVTPAYRSGIVVDFPVTVPSFGALRAVLPSGEAVPESAVVRFSRGEEPTIVGLDGTIYLSGSAGKGEVTVEWGGNRCSFEVELPGAIRGIPQLGEFVCGDGS